jgi:hypothetical protein
MLEIIVKEGELRDKNSQSKIPSSHLEYFFEKTGDQGLGRLIIQSDDKQETTEKLSTFKKNLYILRNELIYLNKKIEQDIRLFGETSMRNISEKARLKYEINELTSIIGKLGHPVD